MHVALRALATLLIAGGALHELRYMSWLGEESSHAGSHRLDGLLTALAPILTVALTGLGALALLGAVRSRALGATSWARMRNLWLIASGSLLAIYSCQELLQGALEAAHPVGLHGLFGHGGWIVVPFALLLGGIVAIAVGVVRELERRVSWGLLERLSSAVGRVVRPTRVVLVRSRPLAEHLAGRGPPLLVD
jgi:hypothetical protein